MKRQRKPGTPSTPTGGAGRGRKPVPAKTPAPAPPASSAAAPQIPTALPVSRLNQMFVGLKQDRFKTCFKNCATGYVCGWIVCRRSTISVVDLQGISQGNIDSGSERLRLPTASRYTKHLKSEHIFCRIFKWSDHVCD